MLTGAAVSVRTSIRITVIIISRRIITAKPTVPCSKAVARADCRHFFFLGAPHHKLLENFHFRCLLLRNITVIMALLALIQYAICMHICVAKCMLRMLPRVLFMVSPCLEVWIALNLFIRVKIKFQ